MEAIEVAGISAGLGAMSLAKQLRRIGEDKALVSQSDDEPKKVESKMPDVGDNVDSREALKSFVKDGDNE